MSEKVFSIMLIMVVFCWGVVWTFEVDPILDYPFQVVANMFVFIFIALRIWRGADE